MNITLSIDQFIPRCIYFGDPVQNTIMENSRFIKLIYSTELVIMNGLYFEIPLNISHKATYFRRNKYFFDMNNSVSQGIIKKAQEIEYAILKKYSENRQSIFSRSCDHDRIPLKHMKPMVFDSFQHGCIKSESGTEFHNDERNKDGGSSSNTVVQNNNNSNNSGSQSTTFGLVAPPHPIYHLSKQRHLRHTFESSNKLKHKGNTDGSQKFNSDMAKEVADNESSMSTTAFTSWHVILKVSGIWETMTEFGLTYKFIITPKYSES